jgi:hypothetical protein
MKYCFALALFFCSHHLFSSPVWEKYSGTVPPAAMWIGMSEVLPDKSIQEFVICRGLYKETMFPGRTSGSDCLISVKGDIIKLKDFEVFKHNNSVKFQRYKGSVPKDALSAGGTMDNLQYICTTRFKNLWLVGNLDDSGCKISYKNKEHIIKEKLYILVKK